MSFNLLKWSGLWFCCCFWSIGTIRDCSKVARANFKLNQVTGYREEVCVCVCVCACVCVHVRVCVHVCVCVCCVSLLLKIVLWKIPFCQVSPCRMLADSVHQHSASVPAQST